MKILLFLTIIASFYHTKFEGRKTANGEIFSNTQLTAAYNHVPLGSILEITNLKNKNPLLFYGEGHRLSKNNSYLMGSGCAV